MSYYIKVHFILSKTHSNYVTVMVASPSDILLEQNGQVTSIDQYGNTRTGIESSVAYMAGHIKVVQVPESDTNYVLTLKGTAAGETDVVVIQPAINPATQQQTAETAIYEDIPTAQGSVASRDIGKTTDAALRVDTDNDGAPDQYKQPNSIGMGIPTAPEEPPLLGDFNGDGRVAFDDFLLFVQNFGKSIGDPGYDAKFDLDGKGDVNFSDFLIFVQNYGTTASKSVNDSHRTAR